MVDDVLTVRRNPYLLHLSNLAWNCVFRILDEVNFKAKFSRLPQFKPDLIPTPGTPKELPTTPDVAL